jgi:tetratricopeptide (TPR) repeat protein
MMRRAALSFAFLCAIGCAAPRSVPEATPPKTLEAAREAFKASNFGIAEDLYRGLLESETMPAPVAYLRFKLGRCLQARRKFEDAREEFSRVLADDGKAFARDSSSWEETDGIWGSEDTRDIQPAAQAGIAECFEAEGRWSEALAAYLASRDKHPRVHWCGNCKYDRRQKTLDGIERCIRRLDE